MFLFLTSLVFFPVILAQVTVVSYSPESGFSCRSIRYRNKCYYLALSKESWHTAKDYCSRVGNTLARIESADEATFLASYLRGTGVNLYWIDLNDERTEGVWTWSDHSAGYTDFWAAGEPNGQRWENCGLLVIGDDGVGRLVDEPCREWRRYICEKGTDSSCQRAGYKQKCYWYSVQPATWFNAREYCAVIGKRLARITSRDEANFIALTMPRPGWVDLRYGGQGVGWTYADGSSTGIFGDIGYGGAGSFGYGQRCAELRRYRLNEGRVVGEDCNMLKQFICESEPMAAGAGMVNPEDEPGTVMGSLNGGQALGPAGPVNPMDPQMGGGIPGMGPFPYGGSSYMPGMDQMMMGGGGGGMMAPNPMMGNALPQNPAMNQMNPFGFRR